MPYIHFAENSDIVKIAKSKIKNAGQGLFAKKSIKKDDFICWYTGVFVLKDLVDRDYYDSDYLLGDPNGDFYIDADSDKSCFGRYANDGFGKNNSEFVFYDDIHSAALIATKDIKKGDEIYTAYGLDYWTEPRRYSLLSTKHKEYIDDQVLLEQADEVL